MHGLKLLEFVKVIISSEPKFLPNSLRIIHWSWYPSKFLPPNFHPCFLTELRMRLSKLVRLWNGTKNLPNLKIMDLCLSDKLTSTPDFTGVSNLEELNLEGCNNLVEIHPSFAVHKRLKVLNLCDCESIRSLPNKVEMDSLECFDLSGCSKVKKIPEFTEQMQNLSKLVLDKTAIEKIPSSIEHLVALIELSVCRCKNLLGLPSEICNLKSLKYLDAEGCSKLDNLPGEMECLEKLYLGETAIREPLVLMKKLTGLSLRGAPAKSRDGWGVLRLFGRKSTSDADPWKKGMALVLSSLNRLCSLQKLYLLDCDLCDGDIPDDIGSLSSLIHLDLSGNNFVSLPESIGCLSSLLSLVLGGCKRLQQLSHLPSNGKLHVTVDNCTSLKWLSDADPSKLSRYAELDEDYQSLDNFTFSAVNCFRLVENESWTNCVLPKIISASRRNPLHARNHNICPGSDIPEWFSIQSVGHSLHVELPPQSCTNWLGITFCLVFTDPRDPAGRHYHHDHFEIFLPSENYGHWINEYHVSEHLWIFYWPRDLCEEQFLFKTHYSGLGNVQNIALNTVKKCGARLVYKQDLEEFNQTLKILKRTHEYSQEAGPSGSGKFGDEEQPPLKRIKEED